MGEWESKWKQSMHIVFILYLPVRLKCYEKLRSNFHSCTLYNVGHILLCKSLSLPCLNFNINVILKSMAFISFSLSLVEQMLLSMTSIRGNVGVGVKTWVASVLDKGTFPLLHHTSSHKEGRGMRAQRCVLVHRWNF